MHLQRGDKLDKTFDEAIHDVRNAERGVDVREALAQGFEYVKQYGEAVMSRQEEAVQSAETASAAAATATNQANAAAQTVKSATESAVNAAAEQATASKASADASARSAESASSSKNAAASSASAAKSSADAAAKSAAEAKAVVTTDKTLSIDGAPADAKTVGESFYKKSEADAKFGNFYTKPEVDTLLKGVNPYPVGSIYQSTDVTSPAELFGGTWEQVASERVLMGASSTHAAGATVDAGLPDITGTVGATYYNTAYIGGANPNSGAFNSQKSVYNRRSSGDSSSMDFYNVDFAASNSNAIYGRSSTVQPAAYYVYIWRRIA